MPTDRFVMRVHPRADGQSHGRFMIPCIDIAVPLQAVLPMNRQHLLTAICVAALGSTAAHAGIGGTPFSLTLGQEIAHDSNMERIAQGRGDTKSTTSVTMGFDKSYGRQTVSAAIQGAIERYKQLTIYDNDSYDVALMFETGLGRSSRLTIDQTNTRSLQSFDDLNSDDRSRNVITGQQTTITGVHGLYGDWQLIGTIDRTKYSFERSQEDDRTSLGFRAAVRYVPTDLLNFEVGVRRTKFEYEKLVLFRSQPSETVGDEVNRTDIDFQTNWTITGLSQLNARLNWTSEKHDSMDSSKPDDSSRDYNGLTGSLSWSYTPRGKVSYAVQLSRDTNNSGGYSTASSTTVKNRLNTDLTVSASWVPTAKVKVTGRAGVMQLEEEEKLDLGIVQLGDKATGTRSYGSLGVIYKFDRHWQAGCTFTGSERSRTIFSSGYSSKLLSCSGSLVMD